VISRISAGLLLVSIAFCLKYFGPQPNFVRGRDAQASAAASQTAETGRVRVATGEYRVYTESRGSGIGPFAPAVYNFTESWELWRLPDGSLEATGERDYDSPEGESHADRFSVRLSSDFKILGITEFRKLRWLPDSGPLSCDFLPGKLACSSGAKEPVNNVNLDLTLDPSYGFLWPISAFSISNITRFSREHGAGAISVQLVTVDEPSRENPVYTEILGGQLRYLGKEEITVARRRWKADKFGLKVPLHAPFLIWTSERGLLLDFAEESNEGRLTENGMSLVRFQQLAAF
jgi:hypothetical protein